MHQLFSYEEARKLDALRAAHASDPVHSAFTLHRRPVLRAWRWARAHARLRRDVVIDLRTPLARIVDGPELPEFLDLSDPIVQPVAVRAPAET